MNQIGREAIEVALEEIRIKLAAGQAAIGAEDGEEAFAQLRAIHGIADRTINRRIVERMIETRKLGGS